MRFGKRSIYCHPSNYWMIVTITRLWKWEMKTRKHPRYYGKYLTSTVFCCPLWIELTDPMFWAWDANVTPVLFRMLIDILRINGLGSSLFAIITIRHLHFIIFRSLSLPYTLFIFSDPYPSVACVGMWASRKVTWEKGSNYTLSPLSLVCLWK